MQATQAALLEEIAALQVQVRELTSGGQVDYPNASFCGGEILHNLNSGTTATSVMSYSATAQDVYAFRIDPDTGTLFKVTVAQQLSYGNVFTSMLWMHFGFLKYAKLHNICTRTYVTYLCEHWC